MFNSSCIAHHIRKDAVLAEAGVLDSVRLEDGDVRRAIAMVMF